MLAFAGTLKGSETTAARIAAPAPPFAWDAQTADPNGDTGLHTSIALTGADVSYVSYLDASDGEVRLAHRVGANWSSEIVAGPGAFAGDTNVAIAPNNTLEISYFDQTQNAVMYATKGLVDWSTTRIDSGFSEGFNRLALDSSGRPSIVYTGFDGSLRLATWNGTRWSIEIVDDRTVTSRYADVAFDPLGRPHISYYGNGTLLYAERKIGGWSRTVVDSTQRAGWFCRIRIDSRGMPHIAYYASSNASLMYATQSSSGWTLRLIDGQGDAGFDLSLAIDRQDRAQIAYYARAAGDLRYAIETDQDWIRETVDALGVVGWYTGIALDSLGLPHISYYDWTDRDLRYARGTIALQVRSLGASAIDSSAVVLRGELVALGNHSGVGVEFALRVVDRTDTMYPAGNLTMARIFSIVVANLTMDTLYEFRAVATAGNETSEGATLSFRLTSPLPPSPPYALLAGIGIGVVATVGILSLVLRRRKRPPADPRLPVR